MSDRREFLGVIGVGALAGLRVTSNEQRATKGASARRSAATSAPDAWDEVPAILARIKAPTFPDRAFDAGKFGAVADGTNDCTDALQAAIDACHAAGGGRVNVPGGRVFTGPLRLRSNVNLVVKKGATLVFSTNAKRFPIVLTRFEGVEVMNYAPLLYAYGEENIAITGEGTLDGGASCLQWWPWKGTTECSVAGSPDQKAGRDALFAMAEKGVPPEKRVFGDGFFLRPSFIEPYKCRNVLIEGVTIVNAPMWLIHPVLSTNVTVRGVTMNSHGPNNDGCDPESCTDVLIEKCTFDTGDDCIAIKSGRNADGRRLQAPTQNVIVRECVMKDGHGGVSVGSEISGGVRNVFIEKCEMSSPQLERALRLKTNAMRGGVLESIHMRDVKVGQVKYAILDIDFNYEEGEKGAFLPTVRNVDVRNVTSQKSAYALFLKGFEKAPITDVHISDCTFSNVANPDIVQHVKGLALSNVTVNGKPGAP
jgi:polygalacturonase